MKSAGRVERNAILYLTDILQAAREIVDYAAVGREAFLADRMRQRAVIQCFEVIGEATKKLPDGLRSQAPAVPWRHMAAFRDKLIHDYFEIDLNLVWATAVQEIPGLIPQLEPLLLVARSAVSGDND
ncbi:HepT-like ribonuclease domain-containing protein [Uliginosibacterium sp. H1]|uniref:HepT-like ribonuclease domain-containing protein n=1 Tax=Uliginosibacterium sp. H1 TaxID=3114757 RepID=UPI002E16E633|nr:DUF86 domain-containing protein [Uliginosibacterium sp. H1]